MTLDWLAVPCPVCQAPIGKPCHPQRHELARLVTEETPMAVPDPLSSACERRLCDGCDGTAHDLLTDTDAPCSCRCHRRKR